MKKMVLAIMAVGVLGSSVFGAEFEFIHKSVSSDNQIVIVDDVIFLTASCSGSINNMKEVYDLNQKYIKENKNLKKINFSTCLSKYTQKGCCDGIFK